MSREQWIEDVTKDDCADGKDEISIQFPLMTMHSPSHPGGCCSPVTITL
jgi:hypothetical protein